eukprot:3418902-Prymnesium_polylepis.1
MWTAERAARWEQGRTMGWSWRTCRVVRETARQSQTRESAGESGVDTGESGVRVERTISQNRRDAC